MRLSVSNVLESMRSHESRDHSLAEHCAALLLVGGLGTRLSPVFAAGPKCMAPVGGRPFLEYLLLALRSWGFSEVILAVGYKASAIESHYGTGDGLGMEIRYSMESESLGTAGALKNAEPLLPHEHLLVVNGDSFLEVDLHAMFRFHREQDALATIGLKAAADPSRYGSVLLDSQSRIVAFREKAPAAANSNPLINGGIYLFQREILNRIPSGRPVSLERETLPSLVGKGMLGFVTHGFFIDIGTPEDYERVQADFPMRLSL